MKNSGTVFVAVSITLIVSSSGFDTQANPSGPIEIRSESPTSKDQCKDGGWMTFTNPSFLNQGDCIQYVNQL